MMAVMLALDLLDRLLEHDAWTTRRVLDLAQTLTDEQLDRDFDIGHRTVRETFQHMIGNIEVWTGLMTARPVHRMPTARLSFVELRRRFEAAFREFAQVAREMRDTQQLGETVPGCAGSTSETEVLRWNYPACHHA
jgi:uncharacterized damage-inducible protein DinB